MKSPRDHALALLKKAANDLVAARATVATGKAFDAVCFHSQQAVEKSLKAILALQDVEYPWRHDLGELLELVKPLAPEVAPFEDRILGMTPFAVEIRYDEEFEPSTDEANKALQTRFGGSSIDQRYCRTERSRQKLTMACISARPGVSLSKARGHRSADDALSYGQPAHSQYLGSQ